MKTKILFAFVLLTVLSACNGGGYNKTQKSFLNMFNTYQECYDKADAEGKLQAYVQFDSKFRHFNDTIPYFINWKGKVRNVAIEKERIQGNNYPVLHFEIELNSGKKSMHRLGIWKVLDENTKSDPIYSALLHLNKDSVVWFDGTFWKEKNNLLYWMDYKNPKSGEQYPLFRYVLFRVTNQSHGDSLSDNLKQILAFHHGLRKAYQQYYNQVITDQQWNSYKTAYTQNVEKQRQILTSSERDWNRLFLGYILSDDARFYVDWR